MKTALVLLAVMIIQYSFGQCPFPVQLLGKGNTCLSTDTLTISTGNSLTKIAWFNNSQPDTTLVASVVTKIPENAVTVAGGNGAGSSLSQFNSPSSIFIDAMGNSYVADRSNYRVLKFPPNSSSSTTGQIVAGGNGPGKAGNQLQPNAVFVDAGGNLYVADYINNRVLWFPQGSTSATIGTVVAGGNGAGPAANQISDAVSVFVDDAGYLYVIDAFNDRVQKFPPQSTSHTNAVTVAGGNDYGNAANQFNGPSSVFVDKDGNIYVDDAANNRIQKFPPNSTSATMGITIAGGNGFGSASNQLATPSSIWVDKDGYLYVADINNERVQKFPPGSTGFTNGITVAGGNGQGIGANQFSGPNVVWGDNNGKLYVSDVGNNRIQRFSIEPVRQYIIDTFYLPRKAGTYTAMVTDTLGCSTSTNGIIVNPSLTPAVTVTSQTGYVTPCKQNKADFSFMTTTINGGTAPSYQWQVNGVNAGNNMSSFSSSLANGDVVSCLLTSNAVCTSPAIVLSNPITVSFASKPVTSIKTKNRLCADTDTLFVSSDHTPASIAWYVGETLDTIIIGKNRVNGITIDTIYQPSLDGAYKAIVTDTFGCLDTTNTVVVNPTTKPQISISADKAKTCVGDPMLFTSVSANAGTIPVYQWQINGIATGENKSSYSSNSLGNGDTISCLIYGDTSACFGTGTSNKIIAVVKPIPVFENVNDLSVIAGQSIVLSIPVTGDIISYAWQPTAGFSGSTLAHPVATPIATTVYTLHVLSADSCAASDSVKIIVTSHFLIPGSFSPDGDGLNDRFYVLRNGASDKINQFVVFSRQGQVVFQAHNMLPGDAVSGWDGTCNGREMPAGVYIYKATAVSANGSMQVYKGTVVLIR